MIQETDSPRLIRKTGRADFDMKNRFGMFVSLVLASAMAAEAAVSTQLAGQITQATEDHGAVIALFVALTGAVAVYAFLRRAAKGATRQ